LEVGVLGVRRIFESDQGKWGKNGIAFKSHTTKEVEECGARMGVWVDRVK
jgi:hypothetical protein